jgi:hypothetical protein
VGVRFSPPVLRATIIQSGFNDVATELHMKISWRSKKVYDVHGYLAHLERLEDGTTRTVYVHREVMQKKMGRPLKNHEIVHHNDEDKKNNDPDNLTLSNRSRHAKGHRKKPEWCTATCAECGKTFKRLARRVRASQGSRRSAGPFCSRKCSGRYNQRKQKIGRGGSC